MNKGQLLTTNQYCNDIFKVPTVEKPVSQEFPDKQKLEKLIANGFVP